MAILMAAVFPAVMGQAGCYRHVIDAKGPNASSYNIYEPNYEPKEEKEGDGLFGGNKKDDKRR